MSQYMHSWVHDHSCSVALPSVKCTSIVKHSIYSCLPHYCKHTEVTLHAILYYVHLIYMYMYISITPIGYM